MKLKRIISYITGGKFQNEKPSKSINVPVTSSPFDVYLIESSFVKLD